MIKTCLHCGKEFTARQFWARYCSTLCRVKAYQKRKKQQAKPQQPAKPAGV